MVSISEDRASPETPSDSPRRSSPRKRYSRRIDCADPPRGSGEEPAPGTQEKLEADSRDRGRDSWYR